MNDLKCLTNMSEIMARFMNDLKKNNPELTIDKMIYWAHMATSFRNQESSYSNHLAYTKDGKIEMYKYCQDDVVDNIFNIRVEGEDLHFDSIFKVYDGHYFFASGCVEIVFDYDFYYTDDNGMVWNLNNIDSFHHEIDDDTLIKMDDDYGR